MAPFRLPNLAISTGKIGENILCILFLRKNRLMIRGGTAVNLGINSYLRVLCMLAAAIMKGKLWVISVA